LYVAFQSHVSSHDGEPIDAFVSRALAAVDSLVPERVIIDVRDDLGGDSYYNLALVQGLIRRVRVDQPDRLFVIIGRGTYSAAMNLVTELERYTHATFVGEPTGSPPAFFGDHLPVRLPHSGIELNISTQWWVRDPYDHRTWVPPAIYAEPSSADYRAGVDPALQAILERGSRPGLAARLDEALAAGDTAHALRVIAEECKNPENRFVNVEARVNAIGYALLHGGQPERAAQVLAVNARAFPGSANAYDSLGEVLERLGQRDDAIAAYRRALEIVPDFPSSRNALARLGVRR
jgi:tetratricopeptide (TPR) repeat protein